MDEYYKSPMSTEAEKHYEKVKGVIHYCGYDQSYGRGDVNWIQGEKATLGEVLADYRVPDKYIDQVASHMRCSCCGYADFDRYSDIGLISRTDAEIQGKIWQANKKYKKSIDELLILIEQYPSLVLKNALARKIYKEIHEHNTPSYALENIYCYRCRMPEKRKKFTFKDIHAPKVGIAKAGRYNHSGQSVLYLSHHLETAVGEVSGVSTGEVDIWLQKYRIGKIEQILDLSPDWEGILNLSTLFTALIDSRILKRKSIDAMSTWRPEYLLTIFIADCAKSSGYRGIKYPAIKGYGDNYVIFDPSDKNIAPVGSHERRLFDFNKDSKIVDW